jgi:uncharacterized protein YkwD
MRRKPVVVGIAAVLMVAGGIAATRAGAAESSEWPGFSFFSDDDDAGAGAGAGAGSHDSDFRDSGSVDSGFDDSGSDDSDFRDSGDGSGVAGVDDRAPVVRDRFHPGNGHDSTGHVRSDSVTAGAAHAVHLKPAPHKAVAVVPAKPHQIRPAQIRPAQIRPAAAGGLEAAAKREVTASDVSSNPASPVQQQVLWLINQNRRAHGCGRVTLDRRLIRAANGHADDMARHRYFAHESPDGESAGDRVTGSGYDWRRYGENIAMGMDSPYAVVSGWMHSPEHRHNILDCRLDQMGIGIAVAGDRRRTIYWVQDFATPM